MEHENSDAHRNSVIQSTLLARKQVHIDSQLHTQYGKECEYWRNVLRRVVAVLKFLAQRGLAYRGENEIIGSPQNGNFLGCIELLAEFDPFLAGHLSGFGNAGKGNVSYLSSTTCNEFIQLMVGKVFATIVSEVKISKYYSISVVTGSVLAEIYTGDERCNSHSPG